MPTNQSKQEPVLEIAVVGGGIIGIALTAGLVHRGVEVKLYERASAFRPIGGGIGFTPNSLEALRLLHPGAFEGQQRVATVNGDPDDPNDWLRYLDGYHHHENDCSDGKDKIDEPLLFELYTGYRGFEGCVRADLLNEWLKLIPPDVIQFGKSIQSIGDQGDDDKLRLHFGDGTFAEADAVIGCDGIKSRIRKLILGDEHPAAEPSYNHQYALRGVLPMPLAIKALGEYKARNRHMHLGPGAYVATVPIALGAMVNVVAFVPDPGNWDDKCNGNLLNGSKGAVAGRLTAPADPDEVLRAFSHFSRPVRNLIRVLIDWSKEAGRPLDKWGIFDSVDHPTPTFAKGRVCIAGDAAHASAPHHGAGAGMGLEDCLVLATLLADVATTTTTAEISRAKSIRAALVAYSHIRKARTQWVAESSRVVGQLLDGCYPPTLRDWDKCLAELTARSHRIWHHDQEAMIRDARKEYQSLLV